MNQGFPTPQKDYYKVYVNSITFNQAPYIEDNLNGVAMQETNFPFVHHVIDDCSTDGEQDVIKTWMEKKCDMENAEYYDNDICSITLVKNKTNPNCTLAAYLLKKNLWKEPEKKEALFTPWQDVCPYEALCEGDDYWIDPKKLQKQVDFLDSHLNFAMCFHNAIIHYESKEFADYKFNDITEKEYSGLELFSQWIVPTASVLFRKEVLNSPLFKELCADKRIIYGDLRLVISCAHYGKVYGFSEAMSVYRRTDGSLTGSYNSTKVYKEVGMAHAYMEHLGGDYSAICKYSISALLVKAFYFSFKTHEKDDRWKYISESFKNSFAYTINNLISMPLKYIKNGGKSKIN